MPAAERAHVDWCLALDRWVDKGAESHGRLAEASHNPLSAAVALAQAAPQWHLLLGHEYGDLNMHQNESLNLKVITQDGNEHFFRLRFNTPLHKLMRVFCNRSGIALNSVRFLFHGQRLGSKDETPWTLEMLNGNAIDVMIQQMGN